MYQSKKPYLYGTGRRKSSVARVHLFPNGTGSITVNGRSIDEYFGLDTLKMLVRQPLEATGNTGKMDVVATVTGGGVSGQAGALRHGIARALLLASEDNRPILKKAGFLTRDPRMKERKIATSRPPVRAPPVLQALILRLHFQNPATAVWRDFLNLLQPLHNGAALAFTPSVCYYIPQRQISTGGFYADKGSIGLQSGRPACGKGAGSSV